MRPVQFYPIYRNIRAAAAGGRPYITVRKELPVEE